MKTSERPLWDEVIDAGLCTHCGTCAGLSAGTIKMVETRRGPLPEIQSAPPLVPEISYAACPGKGLDYPALHQFVFETQPDNWLLGCYRRTMIGYSRVEAIRRQGASGGVITQVLFYLLEEGLIDGAIVVQQGEPEPWEARAIIARSTEEIARCSQSVYRPVPVNTILAEMAAFEGRLAYVGLPDQVASLRRLQQLGHPSALKVKVVLGPYTGTNMYFEAIRSFLRANGIRAVEEVVELRYREGEWPGYLHIKLQNGRTLRAEKFYYNYLIPFFITQSTLLSTDFTNELTDISVGDAWSPRFEAQGQGFSVVVARTEQGEAILQAMQSRELLEMEEIPVDEALSMHGHMLDFKKRGAFIRIAWRRALGKAAPEYGYHPSQIGFSRKLVEAVIIFIFLLAGTRLARFFSEIIPIGILGPAFNLLRKGWKNASKPVKRKNLQSYDVEFTHPVESEHV